MAYYYMYQFVIPEPKFSHEDRKRLLPALKRKEDHYREESACHRRERDRLDKEVKKLQDHVKVTKDKTKRRELQDEISLLKAKSQLAASEKEEADAETLQAIHEQDQVRGVAGAIYVVVRCMKTVEKKKDNVKKNTQAVEKLTKKRVQYKEKKSKELEKKSKELEKKLKELEKKSKQLLDAAMKASSVCTSHHLAGVESGTTHNVSLESETQCSEYASPSTSQSSLTVATFQPQRVEQSLRPSGAFHQPSLDTKSHSPHVHEEASTSPTFTVPTSASCTTSNVVETGRPISSTKSSPLAKPTSRNLTLIEWKNAQGERKQLRLMQLICHKWKDIGCVLDIPLSLILDWEEQYRGHPINSITAVLDHWFKNPRKFLFYPLTWEGLDNLLNDAELGQVAEDLKQALTNAAASY